MGIFAAIIAGVALYVLASQGFDVMVTGTTGGEQVLKDVMPIALAVICAGVVFGIFKR